MTNAGSPEFMHGVVDSDRTTWPQCKPDEFWQVGMHLDLEYPVPTDDELRALWEKYMNVPTATTTERVFGVYTSPERSITAVASVDLCEMVRETRRTLHKATGVEGVEGNYLYSEGTWFDIKKIRKCRERSVVESVTRVLMNAGLIEPVEGVEEISNILGNWRKAGVWVVANTSTLPGCEAATIKYTLGETMKGQFDGLVLPRNHDGNGDMTKATALNYHLQEASIANVPIVHLDDAPHHHAGFVKERNVLGGNVHLFAPSASRPTGADFEFPTPLDTFKGATALFKDLGVMK